MARERTTVYTNNEHYQNIADAIREKNGTENTYTPAQMAPAIKALVVSGSLKTEDKTVTPTKSIQQVRAAAGYDALGTVTVNAIPSQYIVPDGSLTITENDTYDITDYEEVVVNVATGSTINNQNKTITPTEERQYATPDTGYTGLGQVTVEPISSTYVGSGIAQKTASDLSAAGATVTVPAGYYSAQATKSIATSTQATPSVSINKTNGLVTATATQTAGYVAAGSKSGTLQLSTAAGATITPTTTQQVAVAANKYTLGAINVAAIQTEEKETTVNGEVTPSSGKYLTKVTVNVPTGSTINNQNKSVTPTKSQQSVTADSGYTGLGTVTVNAIPAEYITTTDADAVAANILKDKTAYVKGSKITGSMPNNGATGGTITSQGGTYTIPAGYTTGGTVTANLVASPISNAIINGDAELEDTNDYGFEVEVNIPEGYHEATTLTKLFSSILPVPENAIVANQMLAGYQAYDKDGKLLTGSMTNNGA